MLARSLPRLALIDCAIFTIRPTLLTAQIPCRLHLFLALSLIFTFISSYIPYRHRYLELLGVCVDPKIKGVDLEVLFTLLSWLLSLHFHSLSLAYTQNHGAVS